ncbi:NRDE family protein [Dyella silvatica]|uniref:NRDE family protein n=1 Tax=Dyella silvatica TaxID=2992128 RepID=UPI002254A734|nr:NRDE family protein [Dyella silvatica]
MCLIAFAWNAHPHWRLLLAGNRDEFHARPSAALARWSDMPILAGRDLEAGGTWLGVSDSGRCSVVTNVRDPTDPQLGRSRGLLALDYLGGAASAEVHASHAYYLGNRPEPRAQPITAGVHGLSNADFNTPWPKTRILMQRLQAWLDSDSGDDVAPLFDALADEHVAADAELPDTGVGLERERWLSSAFIRGEQYGTRASTIVALDYQGRGWLTERRFGRQGHYEGETTLRVGESK